MYFMYSDVFLNLTLTLFLSIPYLMNSYAFCIPFALLCILCTPTSLSFCRLQGSTGFKWSYVAFLFSHQNRLVLPILLIHIKCRASFAVALSKIFSLLFYILFWIKKNILILNQTKKFSKFFNSVQHQWNKFLINFKDLQGPFDPPSIKDASH